MRKREPTNQRSVHFSIGLDRVLTERAFIQKQTFSTVVEELVMKGLKTEEAHDKDAIKVASEKHNPTGPRSSEEV